MYFVLNAKIRRSINDAGDQTGSFGSPLPDSKIPPLSAGDDVHPVCFRLLNGLQRRLGPYLPRPTDSLTAHRNSSPVVVMAV